MSQAEGAKRSRMPLGMKQPGAATVSSGRKAELRRSASRTEPTILMRYPIDCFGRDLADCSPSALDWASQRSRHVVSGYAFPFPVVIAEMVGTDG